MVRSFIVASLLIGSVGSAKEKDIRKEKKTSLHDQFVGQGYGMAGCGLGSVIFGDKPGPIQIIAATFNNAFGSQTFGISSGTVNCEEDNNKTASLEAKVNSMVLANRSRLANEAAQGRGETLAALAKVGDCNNTIRFGQALQQNYSTIFPPAASDTDIAKSIIPFFTSSNCAL